MNYKNLRIFYFIHANSKNNNTYFNEYYFFYKYININYNIFIKLLKCLSLFMNILITAVKFYLIIKQNLVLNHRNYTALSETKT